MAPFIVDLLNFSLSHLQGLYNTFKQYYISSSDPVPPSAEDESIELPQLISSILDFVAAIARGGRARDWFALDTLLPSLIAAVLNFTQMTDTDVGCSAGMHRCTTKIQTGRYLGEQRKCVRGAGR